MTVNTVGLVIGVMVVLAGLAAALVAKRVAPGEPDEEPREQKGPDQQRRRLILGAGAGAAVLTATAVAFPAARRAGPAADRLRSTSWSEGRRVVDASGTLVRARSVAVGELLTVYPEGAIDAVDSQAVLVREDPSRFVPDAERPDWIADGIAVYSKLCTHMACPLGLYQQRSGTLLCPCHQAVFDLLDGGRAVQGPARRALPQLPVGVDPDGYVVARGDFSDAVGTGFWGRP